MLPDLIETAADYRAAWRLPFCWGDEQRRSETAADYLQQIDEAVDRYDAVESEVTASIDEYGAEGYELADIDDLAATEFDDRSLEHADITYTIDDGASVSIEYDRNSGVTNFDVSVEGGDELRETLEDHVEVPFYRTGIKRVLDVGRWLRI